MTEYEGVLLVDKPKGITSHDVVDECRKIFQIKKVGHAGTLDPMATGLIVILIGKATKLSQYLMSLDKEYYGTAYFGIETDSQDADGEILRKMEVPNLDDLILKEKMINFIGDQYQIPPMFSAKKVKGKKLYQIARMGEIVHREPRFINISRFELIKYNCPKMEFLINSSKGAYIRTIAHDLGKEIGCGAHLSVLRRTKVGAFSIDDTHELQDLMNYSSSRLLNALLPMADFYPKYLK